jgi:hypothetical protein
VALRVAVPERVRAAAIVCLALGVVLLDESSAQGWGAWLSAALFSSGVALFDGVDEGRLGGRQVGMIALLLGLAAASWSALVIVLTSAFLEASVSPVLFVLLAVGLAAMAAGATLRKLRPGGTRHWQWPRLALGRVRGEGLAAAKNRAA